MATTHAGARPASLTTSWGAVAAGTFGGVAAALQIGKVSATLPLVRHDFAAGLGALSVYIALISIVGAAGGLAFGTVAARVGPRRVGIAGLALLAIGSALGAAAGSVAALLATRAVEAVGFALVVTSMPAYLQARAAPQDRSIALGVWSTWMPLGIALTMVIGFVGLDALGWRGIFLVCAAIPAAAALPLLRDTDRAPPGAAARTSARLRGLLRGQVLVSAGIFTGFSAAYLAVVAFLPTVLVDSYGMAPSRAALVGFLSAIALVPVNVLTGWLIQHGLSQRLLFLVTLAGMLAAAALVLMPGAGQTASVVGAVAFGAFSGAPPAAIWASLPLLAPDPADAPLLSGVFFQSAGIGQVLGPVVSGMAVEAGGGWHAALWAVAAMLAVCLTLALQVRRR